MYRIGRKDHEVVAQVYLAHNGGAASGQHIPTFYLDAAGMLVFWRVASLFASSLTRKDDEDILIPFPSYQV